MTPKLIHVDPFTVRGIRVRTCNRDERDPKVGRLPGLWARFVFEGVAGQVPLAAAGSPVYGVYSHYESDAEGWYDLTAGVAVTSTFGGGEFATVDIAPGDYLVFAGRGPMPQVVIDTWAAVWTYFSVAGEHRRAFATDFELYRGTDEVLIHIGIKR